MSHPVVPAFEGNDVVEPVSPTFSNPQLVLADETVPTPQVPKSNVERYEARSVAMFGSL